MVGVAVLIGGAALVPGSPATGAAPDPSPLARAERALSANPSAVRAAAGDAYQVYSSKVDGSGAAHVRYTRTYRGLRVYGGDFVIHTKADGAFAGASVGLIRPLTLDTRARVSSADAKAAAVGAFSGTVT